MRGTRRAHLDRLDATFYEPFSRENYETTKPAQLDLPAGTYRVVIGMSGQNVPQRYTFAIGDAERFSPIEIPYLLGAIARIRAQKY